MTRLRRLAGLIILSVIWGSLWIASSEIDGHCPPLRTAAIRYGVAAALLLGLSAVRREPMPRGRPLHSMIVLGCTMVALPFLLLSLAGKAIPIGTTAVLFSLAPAALVLAASAGRGAPAPRRTFYAALGGFGAMVVAMSWAFRFPVTHITQLVTVAVAIVFVTASLAFAKRELRGVSLLMSSGIQLAAAALLVSGFSVATERGQPSIWTAESLTAMALLSVLGSAVALPLFYWLLDRREAFQVASVEWLQPVVTVAEAAILLHQRPPGTFYLGAAWLLLCVIVLFWDSKEDLLAVSFKGTAEQNRY